MSTPCSINALAAAKSSQQKDRGCSRQKLRSKVEMPCCGRRSPKLRTGLQDHSAGGPRLAVSTNFRRPLHISTVSTGCSSRMACSSAFGSIGRVHRCHLAALVPHATYCCIPQNQTVTHRTASSVSKRSEQRNTSAMPQPELSCRI